MNGNLIMCVVVELLLPQRSNITLKRVTSTTHQFVTYLLIIHWQCDFEAARHNLIASDQLMSHDLNCRDYKNRQSISLLNRQMSV